MLESPACPIFPVKAQIRPLITFVLFQQFIQQASCSLDWDMGQLTQHGLRPIKALNSCLPSFRFLGFVPMFYICSSMKQVFRIEQQSLQFDSNLSKNSHFRSWTVLFASQYLFIQAPIRHFSPTPRDSTARCTVHFSRKQVYALLLQWTTCNTLISRLT